MQKDLTQISDLTLKDVQNILDLAVQFKNGQINKTLTNHLKGKTLAMIFEKPSLRTKISFELAALQLGMFPISLSSQEILASGNLEKGRESIPDITKNLEKFSDLILARVYNHSTIKEIAKTSTKPVINALCDQHHPVQALTDLMAILLHKKTLKNLKVAFIGDGNNVAISLMQICALIGINFTIASPEKYKISKAVYDFAINSAVQSNAKIELVSDPEKAAQNADIIYTDTFISMGEEAVKKQKIQHFKGYQVNTALLKKAKKDVLFMHCLPAHRGEEVTDEVMDSTSSIVFDQAQCKLYIAKALLSLYLK